MHVGTIKQLHHTRLHRILAFQLIANLADDILDNVGVYVQLDLSRQVEYYQMVRILGAIGFIFLSDLLQSVQDLAL